MRDTWKIEDRSKVLHGTNKNTQVGMILDLHLVEIGSRMTMTDEVMKWCQRTTKFVLVS